MPTAAKLGRTVIYLERLLRVQLNDPLVAWFCESTWQTQLKSTISSIPQFLGPVRWLQNKTHYPNYHISPLTQSLSATKLVVQGGNVFWKAATKSYIAFLSRYQHDVMWQVEQFLSLLSQDRCPPDLAGCWHQGRASVCKCLSHHQLFPLFSGDVFPHGRGRY